MSAALSTATGVSVGGALSVSGIDDDVPAGCSRALEALATWSTVVASRSACQKHLCILQILYGCGLRISEVIALKISDIDSSAMCIHIRAAKGKKDRVVPLPLILLRNLRQYYQKYHPNTQLFEGQKGGRYSAKSIQNFIKK